MINYSKQGRILSLDIGEKTIGYAISDFNCKFCSEMNSIEYPTKNINTGINKLAEKLVNWDFSRIVLGFPYSVNEDFRVSGIQEFINEFAKILKKSVDSKIEIIFQDERFSTQESLKRLQYYKNPKKYKDAVSAQIILESYLLKNNLS